MKICRVTRAPNNRMERNAAERRAVRMSDCKLMVLGRSRRVAHAERSASKYVAGFIAFGWPDISASFKLIHYPSGAGVAEPESAL